MTKIWLQLCLIFCFGALDCFSQKEANHWYFGNGLGLDFSSGTPSLTTGGPMSTSVGCAAISNSLGALLFYTDGVTVWDQTHSVMANGSGLFGTPGAQCCVIVKKPGSGNIYYIFTVQGGGGPSGLCVTTVDMSLSAGNGSVTVKNASVYPTPCEEKITATKQCNQTDVWVLVKQMNTHNFKAVPVTSSGIGGVVTSSVPVGFTYTPNGPSQRGSLKFSPNGLRIAEVFATCIPTVPISQGGVNFSILNWYFFDNSSGMVTNGNFIGATGAPLYNHWSYSTEWSPDGTKLYHTLLGGISQINYCAFPVIVNSPASFGDALPSNTMLGAIQSGPDGKLYVANIGANSLGVIHLPNNIAATASYQPVGVSLGSVTCQLGLPNFFTPYFEKTSTTFSAFPLPGLTCNTYSFYSPVTCQIIPPTFTMAFSGYSITTNNWNFGDPSSGSANTSTLASPTHTFTSPGTYTVKYWVSYYCGRTDTIIKNITVPPAPLITISTPSLSCATTNATVSVSGNVGSLTYTWLPTGILAPIATLPPGNHTLITKDQSTGCTITSTINTNSKIIFNAVNAPSVCAGITAGSATSQVNSGSGNYTYSWSGTSNTSSVVTGLSLGSHTVVVTDATNNCTVTNSFLISQASPLQLGIATNINGLLCTGDSVNLSAMPAGSAPPYNYFWSTGSTNSVIAVKKTTSGTYPYSLVVSDALNCTKTVTHNVIYYATPTLSVNDATICAGKSATITASGANTIYWLPVTNSGSVAVLSPSVSTIYTIVGVTNPCGSSTTFSILVNPSPTVAVFSNAPLCAGNTLSLAATGAPSYQWQGPGGYSSSHANPSISSAQATSSGIYSVTGLGSNNCNTSKTIAVQIFTVPNAQITGNSSLCAGQSLNLSTFAQGVYNWSGPGGFYSNTQSVFISQAQQQHAGLYVIQVTSSDSCKATSSVSVQVYPIPAMILNGPNTACSGSNVTLTVVGAQNYSWSTGQSGSSVVVPVVLNSSFSVTGYNSFGCANTLQHAVSVFKCTGINEHEPGFGVSLFPSPTQTSIRIQADRDLNFILRNSLSVTLLSGTLSADQPKEISLQEYPPGVYFIEVWDGSLNRIYKIVKQ